VKRTVSGLLGKPGAPNPGAVVGAQSKVYCILGDERVYVSRSPAMFSTVIARQGLDGSYVPFRVAPEDLGAALQSLRILNVAGANIGVPYKERVTPLLDVLSEGAQIIGAVNTIVRVGDQWKGYNTNAIGFMDALNETGFEVEGKRAVVIGTGGAARAVAFILNWQRTESLFVVGRNHARAKALAADFGAEPLSLDAFGKSPPAVDLLINATSVSSPDESADLAAWAARLDLPSCSFVVDLNYDRKQNIWLNFADRRGAPFMDGRRPLAHQARRTFALWTGLQVPVEEFLKSLDVGDPA